MELFLLLGLVLTVVVAVDFFYTTLSFNGAGLLTSFVTNIISGFFLFLNQKIPGRFILKFSGMVHVLALITLWLGLLWLGMFCILMSSETSVVHAGSRLASSVLNKLYFTGYVLSTVGNGEFIPSNEAWQMVIAAYSFSGFIFITTALSYIMNLATAVKHKRSLSLFVANMGSSPEQLLLYSHGDGNFTHLVKTSTQIRQMINEHSQDHFAYPLSHYFLSTNRMESWAINLTNLDEALSIILNRLDKNFTLPNELFFLRSAIDNFLDVIKNDFTVDFDEEVQSDIDFKMLSQQGIPLQSEDVEEQDLAERRQILAGWLKSCGWEWSDVYPDKEQ